MKAPFRPGDIVLDKYRVEHVLGRGGMGVVVAARHLELAELFAIKFLLPDALESDHAVERFLREARAAARLKSEHVAKVHDVGHLPCGAPFMVMEHLEGMDLEQVVRKRGPLPVSEAALYVLQACDAVAEAHARDIVHRDIKPANLFLTQRHDGTPCIKVLDFGISKQRTADNLELTTAGTMLGSPFYMSPEQMTRANQVDMRSDVWSMGVVLYKLLTGRLPFTAKVLTELVGRVLQDEPAPPSRPRPDLEPALEAIVLRCLEKQPERRFQTMGELASALRSLPMTPAAGATTGAPGDCAQPAETAKEAPAPAEVDAPATCTVTLCAQGYAMPPARGRARIVASAIAVLAVLGGAGAWLGLRGNMAGAPLPDPAAASTAVAMAPAPDLPSSAALDRPEPLDPPAPGGEEVSALVKSAGQAAPAAQPSARPAPATAKASQGPATSRSRPPASRPAPASARPAARPLKHEPMF